MAESFDKREPRTQNGLTGILGDTPGRLLIRLLLLSLFVGFLMAVFGISPQSLIRSVQNTFAGIFDNGFEFVRQLGGYVLTGAVVVVPLWIVMRVLSMGRKR